MQVTDEWHLAEGGSTLNMHGLLFCMYLHIFICNYLFAFWAIFLDKKVECVKYTIYTTRLLAELKAFFKFQIPMNTSEILQSIKHSPLVFPALWNTEQVDSVLYCIHPAWCHEIPSLPLSSGMFSIQCSDLSEGTTW